MASVVRIVLSVPHGNYHQNDARGQQPRDSSTSTATVLRPVTATQHTSKNARATNFKVKMQN